MNSDSTTELDRDELTDYIYDETFLEEPVDAQTAEDVIEGVKRAIEFEERPIFLEAVSARLTQLGVPCTAEDEDIILDEIKRRFKKILGFTCPRTVLEWIRGTTPGAISRKNHYDLCYALEMDFQQIASFFRKVYLSLPFIIKARVDAVFLYCLYHRKPYSTVTMLLERSKGFKSREIAHTSTSQIAAVIKDIDDDEKFLKYLSEHCYGNKQQFQLARSIINKEIDQLKTRILEDGTADIHSPDRLNSLIVDALLGYRYQRRDKGEPVLPLPKHFTRSLPNDEYISGMIRGQNISYEVLRKSLILLKFNNYYRAAEAEDRKRGYEPDKYEINNRLMDFYDELNNTLNSCGFARLYERHPFDCLLLYCANSYDPILTFHILNERN